MILTSALIQPKRIPRVAALVTLALHWRVIRITVFPRRNSTSSSAFFTRVRLRRSAAGRAFFSCGLAAFRPLVVFAAARSQRFFAAAGVTFTVCSRSSFGGGAFAQVLAAIAFFFANVLMSFGMKVGPDMTGLWLWPLAALYVLRIAKGGDPRLWLGAGAAIGVSLESKYSVAFYAFALVAAVALTPHRRLLSSRWFLRARRLPR